MPKRETFEKTIHSNITDLNEYLCKYITHKWYDRDKLRIITFLPKQKLALIFSKVAIYFYKFQKQSF